MRVLTATEPGSTSASHGAEPNLPAPNQAPTPNQDFAATTRTASGARGAMVLLDGVTPPPGHDGCAHGVPWFAARLGRALLGLADTDRHAPLARCLASAIATTAGAHRTTCDLSHPRTPQATVVCARWDTALVEYLVLSDAVLLLAGTGGAVWPVLDTRLAQVWTAAGRVPPERQAAFVEGRRNTAGGFFTAAADPAVASRAVTGAVPRVEVRALVALSDGVGRWVETFRLGGWAELFAVVAESGPRAAIAQVRAAEAADPQGAAFPRGKVHDDATAVLVEF